MALDVSGKRELEGGVQTALNKTDLTEAIIAICLYLHVGKYQYVMNA